MGFAREELAVLASTSLSSAKSLFNAASKQPALASRGSKSDKVNSSAPAVFISLNCAVKVSTPLI